MVLTLKIMRFSVVCNSVFQRLADPPPPYTHANTHTWRISLRAFNETLYQIIICRLQGMNYRNTKIFIKLLLQKLSKAIYFISKYYVHCVVLLFYHSHTHYIYKTILIMKNRNAVFNF